VGAICNATTWDDITAAHAVPGWLKTAKLGIGMHFMVATVPAYHNEWFIQHEYCNGAFATWTSQNFPKISPLSGGPWGYKDFIPLFTVACRRPSGSAEIGGVLVHVEGLRVGSVPSV
jgi:alpha-L-fucosidase